MTKEKVEMQGGAQVTVGNFDFETLSKAIDLASQTPEHSGTSHNVYIMIPEGTPKPVIEAVMNIIAVTRDGGTKGVTYLDKDTFNEVLTHDTKLSNRLYDSNRESMKRDSKQLNYDGAISMGPGMHEHVQAFFKRRLTQSFMQK